MILITGAAGSLGLALRSELDRLGERCVATDVDTMDVRHTDTVRSVMQRVRPSVVFHLAGAKHAPDGEIDPYQVGSVNFEGTRNVLRQASLVGARVVTASTCKACDPETAYGASKLLAERMTLNAGGSVARFYNVRESSGNVFETWRSLDDGAPVPFTDCWRYFISIDQAVSLLLACAELEPGRYTVDPGLAWHMRAVAAATYPDRDIVEVPRRRGDRWREPRCATAEMLIPVGDGVEQVVGAHDPVPAAVLVAA